MGTGYTRQSSAEIITGAVVEAAPINNELNQLQSAFNASSGHAHDGTTGEGPKIALTTSVSGILPVANGGVAGIHNVAATTAPASTDDVDSNYAVGSLWLDTTNDKAYICVDASDDAAVWIEVTDASTLAAAYQPLDATLTALAGVTTAANKLIYATGSDTFSTTDLTAAGRALLDDASAAAQLVTLGLTATAAELNVLDGITADVTELNYVDGVTSAIQTQLDAKQPLDADLTALAALSGTNTIYYRSGANTWSAVTIGSGLTFSTGTLSADAISDAELNAIAGLTSAADKLPYFTGSGTAALADFTSFARSLADDSDAATARNTLELGTSNSPQFTGVNVGHASDTTITRVSAGKIAVEGVNVVTVSSTDTLTNKSIDASMNTISNILVSHMGASAIVTEAEGISSNDNDTTLPTSAAVKDYVDNNVPTITGLQHTFIDAGAFVPAITNGAAAGIVELATNDIPMLSLDFSTSTEEYAWVKWIPPKRWDGSTISFIPYWTANSGSGGVVWSMAGVAISNDDALDAAVGTAQTSTDTFITANDLHVSGQSAPITIAGTPANADLVYLKIARVVANGSDTLGVDAKLLGVVIEWNAEASTDD